MSLSSSACAPACRSSCASSSAPDLKYDTIGESVGFFRFDERGARRLAAIVAGYVRAGRANLPHEEAVRDLLRERSQVSRSPM